MEDTRRRKLDCPCTEEYTRHGYCKECRSYHEKAGDLRYCKRSRSTSDGTSQESSHRHEHRHDHGTPSLRIPQVNYLE